MTRVSLKEAYDNKDVIAQIYAIRDTAESAVDTSEQAVTTANTASEHVDALVPQVEGAVANANSASASAQASAQTVAGYENRLATVEDATEDLAGDLNAVTLRVTTAEGDIVTIQGRVTALETADGQNIKINRINDYAVGLTGNQDVDGTKTFLTTSYNKYAWLAKRPITSRVDSNTYNWKKAYVINNTASSGRCIYFSVVGSRTGVVLVTLLIQANFNIEVTAFGSAVTAGRIKITRESNRAIVWVDCYGSTPRDRIMVDCLDGFFLANFEENTSDIGYTLDTANNTMTGSDGDIITYTSITNVTI